MNKPILPARGDGGTVLITGDGGTEIIDGGTVFITGEETSGISTETGG